MIGDAHLIEVLAARRDHQPVMKVGDRRVVFVAQRLLHVISRGDDAVPIDTAFVYRPSMESRSRYHLVRPYGHSP